MEANMQSVIDATKEITVKGSAAFITEFIVSPQVTKLGIGLISHYAQAPVAQLVKITKEAKDKFGDKGQKVLSGIRQEITDTLGNFTKTDPRMVTTEGVKVPVTNTPQVSQRSMDKIGNAGKDSIKSAKTGIKEASTVLRVNNMKEFFQTDFGKLLKNISEKTNQRIQGQIVYKVTQKIQHPMLKKGDLFYLDKCHLDHIEIFSSEGCAKGVLNLDGIINFDKTRRALQEVRTI